MREPLFTEVGPMQWELVQPLSADRDLGVITEIFSGAPGTGQEPDTTYP